VKLSPVQ